MKAGATKFPYKSKAKYKYLLLLQSALQPLVAFGLLNYH